MKYDFINTLSILFFCFGIFSIIYVSYNYYINNNYFAIKKSDLPNTIGLTSNLKEILLNKKTLFISFLSCLQWTFQFGGIILLPMSIALPLFSLINFSTIYFSYKIHKIKIKPIDYISSFLCLIGLVIMNLNKILNNNDESKKLDSKKYILGIILITLFSIIAGYLNVISKEIIELSSKGMAFLINSYLSIPIFSLIYLIYLSIPYKHKKIPSTNEYIYTILFFFIFFNLANFLLYYSLDYLSSINAQILLNLNSFFGLLFGYYFFNEGITIEKIMGVCIIFVSVLLSSIFV